MSDYEDRDKRKSGGTRPHVTYHAICWRTMADFDKPHGRANAHGEAYVTPGFDSLGELNDWLSGDTEWIYEEITRYRRAAWAGSQPKDEIVNERGEVLDDVPIEAVPMPEYVKQQLLDLFDKLTNEERLGKRRPSGRSALYRPAQTMDARTHMLSYDEAYRPTEDGREVPRVRWDEDGWVIGPEEAS